MRSLATDGISGAVHMLACRGGMPGNKKPAAKAGSFFTACLPIVQARGALNSESSVSGRWMTANSMATPSSK